MTLFQTQRYQDGDLIEVDGLTVRLRVSPRARRVSLRLDSRRAEMVASAPTPRRLGEAAAFAHDRRGWIAAQIAQLPARAPLAPGALIEVAGRLLRLISAPGRPQWRETPDGAVLTAAGEGEAFARAVMRTLKAEARRRLADRTAVHALTLEKPLPVVSVTDPRGRWGSCSPPRRRGFGAAVEVGRIRYSWRLIFAPDAVLDYVCAHECAHLVEANHSPRFWAVVAGLIGDHRPHRAWLRANGTRLHAIGRD